MYDLSQGIDSVQEQLPEAKYMGGVRLQIFHICRRIDSREKQVRTSVRDLFATENIGIFRLDNVSHAS